jgi:protein O-GlcNAc transferase
VLCVGVPLVTCPGTTFPGRVAASLLGAMEMPELIAANLDAYESLAVALARDPARLKNIREKLAKNKPATPLFDTARFTRRLEAAYTEMWGRWLRGETPSALKMTDPR